MVVSSAMPSETSVNEEGEILIKESSNDTFFPLISSSQVLTRLLPSPVGDAANFAAAVVGTGKKPVSL